MKRKMRPPSDDVAGMDRQELYRRFPERVSPFVLPPCEVKVLMVTDGGGSFGSQDFGLDTLIEILTEEFNLWARVSVTKAHRYTDPDADVEEFRFDNHDLGNYDQIWLIALDMAFGLTLTETEHRAISEFMDDGGGVFATGDHEDLGVAMCGGIPRVRNMRKWHWPDPGPLGEPVAPPVDGPDRLDTLSAGGDPGVQFDDQSDDVPQQISPKMYSSGGYSKYFYRVHPHPVLCGPRGVIRVLPDHPHEGECYVPSDLTHAFTFAGYTTEEYPALPSGTRLAPEVIAWSRIVGGRTADDVKGILNPRTYGAIGVWDGHRVDRGRVLVQATWHHLFNLNLVGELGNPSPVKSMGFLASPAGIAAFEDIKAYFRNVALWLARPETINCIHWRTIWWLRWYHLFMMDLRSKYLENLAEITLDELVRIGSAARDVLGQFASQCEGLNTGWWPIELHRNDLWQRIEPYVNPWLPSSEKAESRPDPVVLLQSERLVDAVLGASIYTLGAQFRRPTTAARDHGLEVNAREMLASAVDLAVERIREHTQELPELLGRFHRGLS